MMFPPNFPKLKREYSAKMTAPLTNPAAAPKFKALADDDLDARLMWERRLRGGLHGSLRRSEVRKRCSLSMPKVSLFHHKNCSEDNRSKSLIPLYHQCLLHQFDTAIACKVALGSRGQHSQAGRHAERGNHSSDCL